MILRVFIFSKNKAFRESQFFVIYAADLIVGIYMSLSEILIGRLFIYITPLCPIIGPYFFTPSIFLKIYFTLSHYAQGFKTISQVLLSLNRMTSVVFPVTYYKSWKNIQTPSMIVLFVMPVGVIWNIIISRVYVNPSSGGFSVNYIKKVEWIYFAFFSSTTSSWRPFLLRALDFTYDFLNLSTTIIFIAFNQQLRTELFQTWTGNNSAEVSSLDMHSDGTLVAPHLQCSTHEFNSSRSLC
ncbi:unnamed protein product [Caenorhabditis nigoni]